MKRILYAMIAVLSAVLLQQHAVQAAGQETVILTAQQGKAAVEIELPDNSGGVSTLRLRVRIEGDTGYLDPVEPMKFEADAEIDPTLLQTRYQKDTGYFTIYISDTGKITDRSRFVLGYLAPNTTDSRTGSLTISVPEDGLEYVDGTGQLKDEVRMQSSAAAVGLDQQLSGKPEENPGNSRNGSTGSSRSGTGGTSGGKTTAGPAGGIVSAVTAGTTGGSADGMTNTAADTVAEEETNKETNASGSENHGDTKEDDAQDSGDNSRENITAVQKGSSFDSTLFYVILAVLSGCGVIAALTILWLRKKS